MSARRSPAIGAWLVTIFLTMLLGLALRFDLSDGVLATAGLAYADVRHAHSHVGFYGALTLAWWLLARRRDLALMGSRATSIYLGVVLVTSTLFLLMGYAPPTIVLSTLVAGFWLVAAWRVWRDPRHRDDWIALAPWGIALGMALIPVIALTARRDFALSRDLAHVFIGVMLLVTFVPVALSSLRVPRAHAPPFAIAGALGTAHVVFSDRLPWPLGLTLSISGLLLALALRPLSGPWWLVAAWWLLPAGLVLMGVVPPLQQEGVRVAALHFLVLGPLLLTSLHLLAPDRIARRPIAFGLALAALAVKLAAMALGSIVALPHAWTIAAWAAVVLVMALTAVLIIPSRAPSSPRPDDDATRAT